MQVDVLTPSGKIFSGEATGVKVPGVEGSFEILNNHAPIISLLEKGQIRVTASTGKTFIEITGGFLECLNNQVNILADSAKVAE